MPQTQKKQDMGTGDVKKLLLQLMIPAVVAQVVNLLYNIVDRIYIGHISGIGAAALTGVGLFTPILMLLNAFAMLIGAGGAPRTAIAMGQGDKEQAEKIISNSFTMLMIFAVLLTVVFYASAPTLLRLFGASDTTLPYALAYSRIYILGSVCVLMVMGQPAVQHRGPHLHRPHFRHRCGGADGRGPVHPHPDAAERLCHAHRCGRCPPHRHCHGPRR